MKVKFVQICACVGSGPDATDSLYALGDDGIVYLQYSTWCNVHRKSQEYWMPMDYPIGKEAALEAIKARALAEVTP